MPESIPLGNAVSEAVARCVPPPEDVNTRQPRYHELDYLRGCMMMLGLVLHGAVAYMQTSLGGLWGFQDARRGIAFDVLVVFLHTFRVPVFFVLAGFFTGLLYAQRGAGALIQNRAYRVLLPLVVGWVILFPVTIAGFAFAQLGGTGLSLRTGLRYALSPAVVPHLQLLHLWFLFDLLVYYAVALCFARLLEAAGGLRGWFAGRLDWVVRRWYGLLFLAATTIVSLAPMTSGLLETPGTFRRPPATLVADGIFFAFGWLLYSRRELLPSLKDGAWAKTVAACALFPVHAFALMQMTSHPGPGMHLAAITSLALITWLFVFGLTGLFVRYLAKPSPVGRYIADASYWFYLIHLPLIAWASGIVAGASWPAGVKFLLVLSSVAAICWVTYEFTVRPTALGAILNGRRYPRGLPRSVGI